MVMQLFVQPDFIIVWGSRQVIYWFFHYHADAGDFLNCQTSYDSTAEPGNPELLRVGYFSEVIRFQLVTP